MRNVRIKMHNRHRWRTQTSLKISKWLKYSLSGYKYNLTHSLSLLISLSVLLSPSLLSRWAASVASVHGSRSIWIHKISMMVLGFSFTYVDRYETYLEKQTHHTHRHPTSWGRERGFSMGFRNVFMPFSQCSIFWSFCCC